MPAVDPVRHVETSLDRHLRDRRRLELDRIAMSCQDLDTSEHQSVLEELQAVLTLLEDLAVEVREGREERGNIRVKI